MLPSTIPLQLCAILVLLFFFPSKGNFNNLLILMTNET